MDKKSAAADPATIRRHRVQTTRGSKLLPQFAVIGVGFDHRAVVTMQRDRRTSFARPMAISEFQKSSLTFG